MDPECFLGIVSFILFHFSIHIFIHRCPVFLDNPWKTIKIFSYQTFSLFRISKYFFWEKALVVLAIGISHRQVSGANRCVNDTKLTWGFKILGDSKVLEISLLL